MPPTVEARFAHDSEKALRIGSSPFRARRAGPTSPTIPEGPASEVRFLAARPSPLPAMTDEAWARTIVGTPRVTMGCDELKQLQVDHRAGFVLSLMDASLDLETLIDLSGMERSTVLDLVRGLYESGVVVFR
jgi:hypothetical protein